MLKDPKFEAGSKKTHRMTKDGLVEKDGVSGEENRVSMRGQEFDLRAQAPPGDSPGAPARTPSHRTPKGQKAGVEGGTADSAAARDPDAPPRHRAPDAEKPRQHPARQQRQFAENAAGAGDPQPVEGADTTPSSTRLQFAADEKPPEPIGKKLVQASRRAERADARLDTARRKLPTRRKARIARKFDEGKEKMKRRLVFDEQVKPRREHLKGPKPLRPVHAVKNAGIGYAHKKLYGVEDENVGTKAAHRGEMAAESLTRSAWRAHKTRPYRRVERLRHKSMKANMKLSYKKALADNPRLAGNPVGKLWQKWRIKRQYARAARDARRAAKKAQQAGSLGVRAVRAVAGFISRHPVAVAIAGLAALLLMFVMTLFSSCSSMAGGGAGGYLLSSYVAEEGEMDSAEQAYRSWEMALQLEVDKVEELRPGYDEYRVTTAPIGHDPHQLMAYLTARYQDFTFAQVQADLREIFAQQYTLTYEEVTETKYRDAPVLDPVTGRPTGATTREPYDWRVLAVTLTTRDFGGIATGRLDAEQQTHYDTLIGSRGNRQYAGSPFAFDWLPCISCHFGWRVHPITGEEDNHLAVDISVPHGTVIIAAHDGVVTTATLHDSYGNYIALDGGNGLVTKYAHCARLLVGVGAQVKAGDAIALVGSTGDSTGDHLHFEVIVNGQHMNPVYFAETTGTQP